MKLPAADWHQRPALQAVVAALDGRTRYVGGAVRDTLLGLPVNDVDMATPLPPELVMEQLSAAHIKVIPTGIDHGTVTAITEDGPVEITTLRRDVSTDGRRATVAFSEDWQEDAARRDFTINALSADPETLDVFDYFDGLTDLEARRIRFIGTAADRIAEDHLRILRYFRFLARFGLKDVDQDAFAACRNGAPGLSQLSRERVADELLKLLNVADPVFAVSQMITGNLFKHVVSAIDPEVEQLLTRLVVREQAHQIAPDPIRRLVCLLPKDRDTAKEIAHSLKLSKKMQKAVAIRLSATTNISATTVIPPTTVIPAKAGTSPPQAPLAEGVTATTIPTLAYYHGVETTRDIALLFAEDRDLSTCLTTLADWQQPLFPITGGDLIAMGLKPGPVVARTLAQVEQTWIAEGFPDEARVKEWAKALVLALQ